MVFIPARTCAQNFPCCFLSPVELSQMVSLNFKYSLLSRKWTYPPEKCCLEDDFPFLMVPFQVTFVNYFGGLSDIKWHVLVWVWLTFEPLGFPLYFLVAEWNSKRPRHQNPRKKQPKCRNLNITPKATHEFFLIHENNPGSWNVSIRTISYPVSQGFRGRIHLRYPPRN